MKLLTAVLLIFVAFGSFSFVRGNQPHEISVKVNNEVSARGGVRVKFIELVDDSRCPKDVNCVWAGNAEIKVRVTKNGRSKVLSLNSNIEPQSAIFAGYRFRLVGLTPEPRSNIRINRNGYVAVIEVKKGK